MASTIERTEYLLLFDGVATAFTTSEDVDDAYVATLGEFTVAHPGLHLPRGLVASLDPTSGMLSDTSASFTIEDVDNTLASLFGSSFTEAAELLAELRPGDTALSTEWGKHVGTELIGPAGQRRRCSCVPGFNVGEHHFSSAQSYAFGLGETPVSDTPLVWPGRRCALYRLVRTSSGAWPDLTNVALRQAALCWFGTSLGQGTQDARTWTLRCAGHESWAMGSLGVGLPKASLSIEALLSIDTNKGEHVLHATLAIVDLYTQVSILETYVVAASDLSYLPGSTTYAAVAAALNLFLADVAIDASSGSSLSAAGLSSLTFSTTPGQDGIQIRWDRNADTNWVAGPFYTLRLTVQAHGKVWRTLGYEPAVQNSERDPVENEDQYGQFGPAPAWYAGHWIGTFYSANASAMVGFEDGNSEGIWDDAYSNGGFARRWPPIYPGGAQVFDMDQVGQELRVRTLDPLFLPASLAVPVMAELDDPTAPFTISSDVGPVNASGILAIRGVYRREGDGDTTKAPDGYAFGIEKERTEGKTTQLARVCWRRLSDGSLALDVDGFPRLVVYEWLEPRLYGIDYPRITGQWASWRTAPDDAQPTTARPLLAFERGRGSDAVPEIFARLLATTGTAGEWYTDAGLGTLAYGLGGTPVLDTGANNIASLDVGDEHLGRFTDAESAGLGLAVPSSMIASAMATDQGSIEAALYDCAVDPVYRCKVVAAEETSARKLISDLLAPTGLCMSLAGGKFGLFDPFTFRPAATTGVVTSEDYAGEPGDPSSSIPEQTLRKLSPIDRIELNARVDPTTGSFARQVAYGATDAGAQYRAMAMRRPISGSHLVHPAIKVDGSDWPSTFAQRWRAGFRWWASQHFEMKFEVHASRAGEFWPGSIVSITDEWVVNPIGIYGVAQAPGFVTARSLDCASETCEVTCIVSSEALVQYSPAAIVTRYDEDDEGEGFRLFCYDDVFGCRGGASFDVSGFVEPATSTAGGNALIEVFAFDSVTWSRGILGEVESVDTTTPGSTFIKLAGALTGATWLRDQDHVIVLRNAADQTAAWVAAVHAPICDKDGTSDGVLGKKWRG